MSRATSFASVSQQMSGAVGVAVAAICIQIIQFGFGDEALYARDLSTAFVLVAIVSSLSILVFVRLKPDAGAVLAGRWSRRARMKRPRRQSSAIVLPIGGRKCHGIGHALSHLLLKSRHQ